MNCLACDILDLQAHVKHSAQGLGKCKREKDPGTFVIVARERTCAMFKAAPAAVAANRLAWVEKGRA